MNPWLMYVLAIVPTLLLWLVFLVAGTARRGVLFGSSVPVDFMDSPQGKRIVGDYRMRGALATTVFIVMAVIALRNGRDNFVAISVPVELVLWFALYAVAFRQTQMYAIDPPRVRVASLAGDTRLGRHLAGMTATLLPLGLAALFLHRNWAAIPAVFPIHWNLAGQPNGWAHRTVAGVYQPIWIGCAVIAILMLVRLLMRYVAGAQNDRHLSGVSLIFTAILISMVFTQVALLPLLNSRSPEKTSALVLAMLMGWGALILCIVLVSLWMLRQRRARREVEPYDGTPDACWRAGIFYFNPSDRAIFVPKRFGMGYSLNFARPVSWLVLAVLLLPILYFLSLAHTGPK